MHGRTHRHLDGLQIQTPRPAPAVEDDAQQLAYLACNFLLDRFRRFFSSGESVSATGRARQIWALTSTNSRCRPCSLRNSAISRSAFRCAAWLERASVAVLPLILYVNRRLGPWPGSLGRWQWQLGLPHRPEVEVIEPQRRSPRAAI